jgi:23S rRNA pseudouridine1911/1915/1917 synthase
MDLKIEQTERKGEWLEIHLDAVLRQTEDMRELAASCTHAPQKWINKLLANKGVRRTGERLLLHVFPEEQPQFEPDWSELDVLFEDDYCLVVNKPAGMAVHPTQQGQRGTLANAVAAYYMAAGIAASVRHIHRLDEHTSGPVLYAKNEFSHVVLDEAMRNKQIDRVYLALVTGVPGRKKGRLDFPIGRDRHHPSRRRVSKTGDAAVTHYEVIEAFGGGGASLLRLRLDTGRTHQIRVHLSHIGHPLLGDALYGGDTKRIKRQALHGEELTFSHPLERTEVKVSAPPPEDFSALLKALRNGK